MGDSPEGWISRILGACVSLLIAALALYGAVQLVTSVWEVLAVIVLVAASTFSAVAWWQHRHSPWR